MFTFYQHEDKRILTDVLTSCGAVRCVCWCPAPVQHFTVVHSFSLQPGTDPRTDPRAVDGNFKPRALLPVLRWSPSVCGSQQILYVKRRTSRRSTQLRSRRFIVQHVHFFHFPQTGFTFKKSPNLDFIKSFPGMCLVSSQESLLLLRVNHPDAIHESTESSAVILWEIQTEISSREELRKYSRKKKHDSLVVRSLPCRLCDSLPWGTGEMLDLGQLGSRAESQCCPQGWRWRQLHGEWHSTAYWLHLSMHTALLLCSLISSAIEGIEKNKSIWYDLCVFFCHGSYFDFPLYRFKIVLEPQKRSIKAGKINKLCL